MNHIPRRKLNLKEKKKKNRIRIISSTNSDCVIKIIILAKERMATTFIPLTLYRMHRETAQRRAISKLETPSARLQPRPSGSISPIYRDNLFTIDPPSYTSESKHVDGRQRAFLGGQTSRPSVQYSNQLASTSGSNPRTGGGGGSSKENVGPRGKSHRRQAEERREAGLDLSVLDNLVTFTAPTVNHARLIRGHVETIHLNFGPRIKVDSSSPTDSLFVKCLFA